MAELGPACGKKLPFVKGEMGILRLPCIQTIQRGEHSFANYTNLNESLISRNYQFPT